MSRKIKDLISLIGFAWLIFGGTITTGQILDDSWEEKSTTNTPKPRCGHSAIMTSATKMVIFGGDDDPTFYNDMHSLDVNNFQWSAIAPSNTPPTIRSQHGAVFIPSDNKMAIFGGQQSNIPNNELWEFGFPDSAWAQLPSTGGPSSRSSCTFTFLPGVGTSGSFIVWGGFDDQNLNFFQDLFIFDRAASSWSSRTQTGIIPTARRGHGTVFNSDKNELVIYGGFGTGGYLDDIHHLNLTSFQWTQEIPISQTPSSRAQHNVVFYSSSNFMIAFGGFQTRFRNDIWIYHFTNTSWTELSPTSEPTPRSLSSMVPIPDPSRDDELFSVLLFGGKTDTIRTNQVFINTLHPADPPINAGVIAAAVIIPVALLAIGGVATFLLIRRYRNKQKLNITHTTHAETRKPTVVTIETNLKRDTPMMSPVEQQSIMTPVQPTIMLPSNRRATSADSEFLTDVEIKENIGSGQFGTVFRGIWNGTTTVACKKFHHQESRLQLKDETEMLKSLNHPNIVQYLGIYSPNQYETYIVMEFLTQGSLDKWLRKQASKVNVETLLSIAKQTAAGMAYLAQNSILHRDLSLRNLLVYGKTDVLVKVGDFGLSKVAENGKYQTYDDAVVPIKWSAPEVIDEGEFSVASDVWSFGITLWEIFSLGKRPYEKFSNVEVIKKIGQGYRLEKPELCPQNVYDLMMKCWAMKPVDRPNFKVIFGILDSTHKEEMKKNRESGTFDMTSTFSAIQLGKPTPPPKPGKSFVGGSHDYQKRQDYIASPNSLKKING